MKHFTFVAAATLVLGVPMLAQPNPGGPVQLRNPHRSGGGNAGGFGGGIRSEFPNGGLNGPSAESVSTLPPPAPVSMIVDGPYLFILRGDTLMQFDKKTLKLLNTVELPRPVAPPMNTTTPAQGELKSYTAPPLRPGAEFLNNEQIFNRETGGAGF